MSGPADHRRRRGLRGSPAWILVAAAIFAAVLGSALWLGVSHSNDPVTGPAPISLSDVIRARGGGLGSKPGS